MLRIVRFPERHHLLRQAWAQHRLPLAEWALQQWQARLRRAQARAQELVALRAESERLVQEQARLLGELAQVDAVLMARCPHGGGRTLRLQAEADRARLFQVRAQLYERQVRLQSQLVPPEQIESALALMKGCRDIALHRVERMRALLSGSTNGAEPYQASPSDQ